MTVQLSALSFPNVVCATSVVLLTTLDDCVWLVPFVANAPTRQIGLVHAVLFVATLESMTLVACLATYLLGSNLSKYSKASDTFIASLGAGFCWILAGVLYYRSWKKRQARKESQERQAAVLPIIKSENDPLIQPNDDTDSTWVDIETNQEQIQYLMVVSLTFLGSIDEISYMPALILGGIFTPMELCLGAFFAAIFMLAVVVACLSKCKPILRLLDRIPLYGVVGFFAVILTVDVLVEYTEEGN